MQKIAITGSSGYLGGKLIEALRRHDRDAQILGLDIKSSQENVPDHFVGADIRSPQVIDALRDFQPDTIVHAAYVFQPQHDDRKTHSINVDGCRNLLRAAAESGAQRVMIISSATAFGAWPDNPVPIPEDYPARGRPEFRYAADKAEVEKITQEFADAHPAIAVSWVRPAIVMGPRMDNYIQRFMFGMPVLIRLDGHDSILQLVHEDDVSAAIIEILARNGRGSYNIGPEDWVAVSEIAKATGRRCVDLPFWLAKLATSLAWFVRFPIHEFPAGFLYFARYPWVVAADRLRNELGFTFRYSSRQTFDDFLAKQKTLSESS